MGWNGILLEESVCLKGGHLQSKALFMPVRRRLIGEREEFLEEGADNSWALLCVFLVCLLGDVGKQSDKQQGACCMSTLLYISIYLYFKKSSLVIYLLVDLFGFCFRSELSQLSGGK